MPIEGWDSVTVPGVVSAWVGLSAKFGKLPFETLFEPAIDYARNGFPRLADRRPAMGIADRPRLKDQPGFAQAFMRNGRAPRAGELFRFPGASRHAGGNRTHPRRIVLSRQPRRERIADVQPRACGGALDRRGSGRAPARLGRTDQPGLSRLPRARNPAQRPGHRRADRAGHPRTLRSRQHRRGFRRKPAPADRSHEARVRRRLYQLRRAIHAMQIRAPTCSIPAISRKHARNRSSRSRAGFRLRRTAIGHGLSRPPPMRAA